MAKGIESRMGNGKTSTGIIFGASALSILLSVLTVRRNPSVANFIGLWAPTILGMGILLKENQLLERGRHAGAY